MYRAEVVARQKSCALSSEASALDLMNKTEKEMPRNLSRLELLYHLT